MERVREQDVVVVGAGPTGLLLAGDLAAAGIRVTVLEQRPEQESNLTRAFAVHARTLEVLDARGLADRLIATGARVGELQFLGTVRLDLSGLQSRFPYVLITPQYNVERLLEERALEHGAQILRGARVGEVRQDGDGVDVGDAHRLRARYLVGADGVRSAVREAVGSPFPGRTVVQSVMLADVRLARAPQDVITANADGDTFAFVAPFGDGWYRVIAVRRDRQLPDDAPVELEEIRATVEQALGTDYGMHEARWLSRFHSDERQVPRYRVGRVFLAGDAAHVHSPAGGLGMNTGLQDAANLGWKLAADLQGWACPGLLDTYQGERHPVGRLALRVSGGILDVVQTRRPALTVLSAVAAAAVRVHPVARRAAGLVSGIAIRYPRPDGAHELVGRRAPDLPLEGAGRLYEALRDGGFVLIGVGDPVPGVRHVRTVRASRTRPAPQLGQTAETGSAAQPGTTVLVRPDGYVGWAADGPTAREVADALASWGLGVTRRSSAAR
jgi:2-polyprenyl-6-methoxyphenol hydroxylase-like FAD-dependent oxidoreductase